MIIISYGITKSGSTLAFETLKGCLIEADFPQRNLPETVLRERSTVNFTRFGEQTEQILDLLLDEVAPEERIAIKTHGFLAADQRARVSKLIENGELLVQISHRDPRDISLSMLDAGKRAREKGKWAFSELATLDDTILELQKQLQQLSSWDGLPNSLHIEYDKLAFSPRKTIPGISEHLGVSATTEFVLKHTGRAFTQKNAMKRKRHRREMNRRDQKRIINATLPYMLEQNYLSFFEKLTNRQVATLPKREQA